MASVTKKSSLLVRAQQRLAGIQADKFGGSSTLTVDGTTLQVAAATTRIQGIVTRIVNAESAATARTLAVTARDQAAPADTQFLNDFDAALRQQVGSDAEVLTQYGISLPVPKAKPSPEQVVAANIQRANTRKARGILGPKQRAALTNPGPTVQVVSTNAAPAAPPTPAAPAADAGAPAVAVPAPSGK